MNNQLLRWTLLMGLLVPTIGMTQDSLTYSLPHFARIQVEGNVIVKIQQGSRQSVFTKRPVPPGLVVNVVDQTLVIGPGTSKRELVDPTQFWITVPELMGLSIGGRSQVAFVNAVVSNHFDLLVKDHAQAHINLVAASMILKLTDAGQVNLTASLGQLRGQLASTSRLYTQGTYGSIQLTKMY